MQRTGLQALGREEVMQRIGPEATAVATDSRGHGRPALDRLAAGAAGERSWQAIAAEAVRVVASAELGAGNTSQS